MKRNLKILFEDTSFAKDEDSVDRQIDRVIYQAEAEAIRVAKGMDSGMSFEKKKTEESKKKLSLNVLFEEEKREAPNLDVDAFANSILRCLLMYEKVVDVPDIIDIPAVIVKRSEKFLSIKYGKEIADLFIDKIKENEVSAKMIQTPNDSNDTDPGPVNQPLAVGASGGGGAGA